MTSLTNFCSLIFRSFFPACTLICTFSLMHNLHSPRPVVYGLAVRIISHYMLGEGLRLFSIHILILIMLCCIFVLLVSKISFMFTKTLFRAPNICGDFAVISHCGMGHWNTVSSQDQFWSSRALYYKVKKQCSPLCFPRIEMSSSVGIIPQLVKWALMGPLFPTSLKHCLKQVWLFDWYSSIHIEQRTCNFVDSIVLEHLGDRGQRV